ncbi:hypothetical protein E4U50_004211 [Claviceps purpurea]|nr:hypothetical protein E4U50_004211 [Claviceps purpurea]
MSETRVSREAEVLSPVVPFRDEAAYFNLPKNAFMKPPLLLFHPPTPSVSENRNFEDFNLSMRVPHGRAPPGSLNFNSLLASRPVSRSSISLRSASPFFSVDPPRPAREGYEWVWFVEGYWAERQPIPTRRAKSGTSSRFWKWKLRYCRRSTSDAQYQASPTASETIPNSTFGIVRATKASPYLSESAHVKSLQNPEGGVDLLLDAGERDSVLPNPQEGKSRPHTTSTERRLSVQRPKSRPRARYVRTRTNGSKYSIFSALNERLVIPPGMSPRRNRSEQSKVIGTDTGLLSTAFISGVQISEELDAGSLPVKTIPRRSCRSDSLLKSTSRVQCQLKRLKAIRKLLTRLHSQYWSPVRSLRYMQKEGHSPEGAMLTPPNTPHATSEFLASIDDDLLLE